MIITSALTTIATKISWQFLVAFEISSLAHCISRFSKIAEIILAAKFAGSIPYFVRLPAGGLSKKTITSKHKKIICIKIIMYLVL